MRPGSRRRTRGHLGQLRCRLCASVGSGSGLQQRMFCTCLTHHGSHTFKGRGAAGGKESLFPYTYSFAEITRIAGASGLSSSLAFGARAMIRALARPRQGLPCQNTGGCPGPQARRTRCQQGSLGRDPGLRHLSQPLHVLKKAKPKAKGSTAPSEQTQDGHASSRGSPTKPQCCGKARIVRAISSVPHTGRLWRRQRQVGADQGGGPWPLRARRSPCGGITRPTSLTTKPPRSAFHPG